MGPLKVDGAPSNTMRSTLGSTGGSKGGGNLGPLRGSGGEAILNTPTGPRLSTDGPMRSSAEAYLRGSAYVCVKQVIIFWSHFLENLKSHSHLKLGKDNQCQGDW